MQPRRFQNPRPYEMLPATARAAVDEVFLNAVSLMREVRLVCFMDDRAEHLMDALADYLFACGVEPVEPASNDSAATLGDRAGS